MGFKYARPDNLHSWALDEVTDDDLVETVEAIEALLSDEPDLDAIRTGIRALGSLTFVAPPTRSTGRWQLPSPSVASAHGSQQLTELEPQAALYRASATTSCENFLYSLKAGLTAGSACRTLRCARPSLRCGPCAPEHGKPVDVAGRCEVQCEA